MKKVLTGIAIGLGVTAFIVWKVITHERNLKDARTFLVSDPREVPGKHELLEKLNVHGRSLNARAESLREELEEQTKEDIINAFKKAFRVSDPATFTGVDQSPTGD